MQKAWLITAKDIRETFTDRTLLLLMFAAPLVLATIIAVTFGGVGADDGGSAFENIPVAIVNLDEAPGTNSGQIMIDILVPPDDATEQDIADNGLWMLIDATVLDDPETARAGVEDGTYTAAVIIPADFTANTSISPTDMEMQPSSVEVYATSERPIASGIVRSVVTGITNQLATGNIAVAAIIQTVLEDNPAQVIAVTNSDAFNDGIAEAFDPDAATVTIAQQSVGGDDADLGFNPFVLIGSAQAIFFALFTANFGALSVMDEQRNWTLQRLIVSPTSSMTILFGKMFGTFMTVLLQLAFLFIAFTVIASLLAGEFQMIWGNNVFGLVVVLFATAIAATGLGAIIAAVARTPEQGGTLGSVIAIIMAVFGGGFGFVIEPPLSYISMIYWGRDALTTLAEGGTDIWLNVIILVGFGIAGFFIGLLLLQRRIDN